MPQALCVDKSGKVYVVDYHNYRVQVFDANGNFLLKFGSQGTGNGQFSQLGGVCVDSLGNIYVTDEVNSTVQKFDSNGNFLEVFASNGVLLG